MDGDSYSDSIKVRLQLSVFPLVQSKSLAVLVRSKSLANGYVLFVHLFSVRSVSYSKASLFLLMA